MEKQVETKDKTLTLTDAIAKVLESVPGGVKEGVFVFELPKKVSSAAAGLRRFDFRKNCQTFVASYRFAVVHYTKRYTGWDTTNREPWGFRFGLCCFEDGGQDCNIDALTLLNYCKPKDLIEQLEARVQQLGQIDSLGTQA